MENVETVATTTTTTTPSPPQGRGNRTPRQRYTDDVSVMQRALEGLVENMNLATRAMNKVNTVVANSKRTGEIDCNTLTKLCKFAEKKQAEAIDHADRLFQCQKSFQEQVGNALLNTLRGRTMSESAGVTVFPMQYAHMLNTHGPDALKNDGDIWQQCDHFTDLLESTNRRKQHHRRGRQCTDDETDDDEEDDDDDDEEVDSSSSHTTGSDGYTYVESTSASAFFGVPVPRRATPPYMLSGRWLCDKVLGKPDDEVRAVALGTESAKDEDGMPSALSQRRDGGNAGIPITEMRPDTLTAMRKIGSVPRVKRHVTSSTFQ